MGRVARVSVTDKTLCPYAVEPLQVFPDLLEYLQAARAVHFANVWRHDSSIIPCQGDSAFHVAAYRKDRLL